MIDTVRVAVDAWTNSNAQTKNYGATPSLRVRSTGPQLEIFMRFKSPAMALENIGANTFLHIIQASAIVGTPTLTVQRLTAPFDPTLVTHASRPAATATGQVQLTKTNPAAGTVWSFPIQAMVQAWTDGTPNYGLKITSNIGVEMVFFSADASTNNPRVEVQHSTAPDKPVALNPSFGRVSLNKWVQSIDYVDQSGSTLLRSVQVQIDTDGEFVSDVEWDSGEVLRDHPNLDLAGTSYPGLAEGATTTVRARVRDADLFWSDWSDPVTVTRTAKGSVAITNPPVSPNNFVAEYTPPITWTFTPPAGSSQTAFQVRISLESKPFFVIHDSGKITSAVNSYTLPAGVLTDATSYRVEVRVWDTYTDREKTIGDDVYVSAWRAFTVAYSGSVAAPSALTATQVGIKPWVDLAITVATAPDSFTIVRDGVAIVTEITPAEMTSSGGGTIWHYRDWTARPEVQHTYRAHRNVNGVLSNASPSAVITPYAEGVWIGDPGLGLEVVLGGKDIAGARVDTAETYQIVGGTDVVRSIMGLGGLQGQASSLMLRTREGVSWETYEARLYDMVERPEQTFRLVFGDLNIPVLLGDVSITPHPDTQKGQVLKAVSFAWWQFGEHPFQAVNL